MRFSKSKAKPRGKPEPEAPIRIGDINTLTVLRQAAGSFVLAGGDQEEILLPAEHAPENCKAGQSLDVFVYVDTDDSIRASGKTPRARVGQCAYLRVVGTTAAGAFMDWGLERDLLVPVSQQLAPMQAGESHVVYLFLDPRQRIIASSKLYRFLDERARNMAPGERVDLLIVGPTGLGYKAVVNGTHLGLLYKDEVFRPLRAGERTTGYIKAIRDDRKINLALQGHDKQSREDLAGRILDHLETHGGTSTLTDYSPPAAIYEQYGVSKGRYKKALGALYKQRLISVAKDRITLLPPRPRE